MLVAGISETRGQKVHNLIHAVEHAAADSEVFVFCDSDARFPRHWISSLIAPLEDETVAVSTGYRWYMAGSGSIPALFRSIWNASIVTALGAHSRNFAWGGSMAIRRPCSIDQVRYAWDKALSDDFRVDCRPQGRNELSADCWFMRQLHGRTAGIHHQADYHAFIAFGWQRPSRSQLSSILRSGRRWSDQSGLSSLPTGIWCSLYLLSEPRRDSNRRGVDGAALRDLVETSLVHILLSPLVRQQHQRSACVHERHLMATEPASLISPQVDDRPTWRRKKLNTLIFRDLLRDLRHLFYWMN